MPQRIALVFVLLISSFYASAQTDAELDSKSKEGQEMQDGAKNNVGIIRVKDSIYMIKGRGGNIGVCVGENGVFMIDDKFPETSSSVIQKINTITSKPIELLVNTHHHGDHTGGNAYMASSGALIFSQENARKRILATYTNAAKKIYDQKIDSIIERQGSKISSEEVRKNEMRSAEKVIGTLEEFVDIPNGALPVVTFPKNISFYYNNEKIEVTHTPRAHTDGDAMVYFTKSNVLHTGDAYISNGYPFIDAKNGGSFSGYMDGLNKILSIADKDTKIIPGHGEIASIEDVKYLISMFRFLKGQIKYQIVAKKTEDEVVAMRELTKEYDDKGFGDNFITTESFIRTLYKELSK